MSEKDTRLLTICVKQQHRKGYSPMYCIVLIMYEVWQLCTLKRALAGCRNGLVMFYRDTFLLKHSLVFVRTLLSHGCTDKQEKVWMLHRADGTYLRRPLQTHTPSSFTYAEVKKKELLFYQWALPIITGRDLKPRRHMFQLWGLMMRSNTAHRLLSVQVGLCHIGLCMWEKVPSLKNKTQAEAVCGWDCFLINSSW